MPPSRATARRAISALALAFIGLASRAAAAQAAVRLNPTEPGPRIALIQALLRTGERERAQREFDIVRRMDPPNLDELRRWFVK